MWESPNMVPSVSSVAPIHFGVGCYRAFIIDYPSDLFLGDEFVPLVKSSNRIIISSQSQSTHNFMLREENLFEHHQIQRKVDRLSDQWKDRSRQYYKVVLDKIDTKDTEILLSTKK